MLLPGYHPVCACKHLDNLVSGEYVGLRTQLFDAPFFKRFLVCHYPVAEESQGVKVFEYYTRLYQPWVGLTEEVDSVVYKEDGYLVIVFQGETHRHPEPL